MTVRSTDTSTPQATPEVSEFHLPCTIDFSILPDGTPPGWFKGSTWSVVSGHLVNTPTLGDELLADPGLEVTYPGGLGCITLAPAANPILVAVCRCPRRQQEPAVSGQRHEQRHLLGSIIGRNWDMVPVFDLGKTHPGGTSNTRLSLSQSGGLPVTPAEWAITNSIYTQGKVSLLSTTTNPLTPNAVKQVSATGLATVVIVDDGSLRKIVKPSLYGLLPATQADTVIKIKPDDMVDNTQIGIVLRANADANPTNAILVLFSVQAATPAYASLHVIKVIGSSYTSLVSNTSLGVLVTDAWFEVRASGNTVSIWYNQAKIGNNLTIEDVELIDNLYHGLFSAGDNRLNSFFCAEKLISRGTGLRWLILYFRSRIQAAGKTRIA